MNNPYALDYQISESIFDNLEYYFEDKINLNKDINPHIIINNANSNHANSNDTIIDISNNILQLIHNIKISTK
jgi:hypothetical protein